MILTTKNLTYTYKNGKTIDFPDINLDAGKKVLISGLSGSGKTTLLNLIAGALQIQTGEIDLTGHQYSTMSSTHLDKLRANHIGYVFQTLNLIPFLSVFDNITLGVRFSKQRRSKVDNIDKEVSRLIESLGLEKTVLNTSVDHLSIGQQQRVAVARALIGMPNLILADEPTSALDSDSTKRFLKELVQTFDASSQALLLVSHDLSLGDCFDEVIDFNTVHA